MAEKILLISDKSVREADGVHLFRVLEQYGCTLEVVQDMVDWSDDKQEEMFLTMETKGADAVEVNPAVVAAMEDADFVITAFSAVPSEGIRKAKHLKAIFVMRSGAENVNLETANECSVKVINAPGRLSVPVSEFTIGLILAAVKNIAIAYNKTINGGFSDFDYPNVNYWFNIKGKNVGLVGCGAIGSRVARVMKAMEANVLVYDPYVAPERLKEQGYKPVSLEELCKESDIITIHFRLTDTTRGMIGKEQFALMKPTAYLINTARAGLVDEEAMMDALMNRKIGGAGLDVFHEEPLPDDSPLYSIPNVTVTPHLAGYCSDIFDITADITINELKHYFETGELINVLNK